MNQNLPNKPKRLRTWTRFETEAKGNSEITYWPTKATRSSWRIYSCTHWVPIFIKYNTYIYTSSSFFDRNGFWKQWRPSILDSLHQNLRATNTVYVSCTHTTRTWVSRTHPHSLDHFLTSVVAMQGETEGKKTVQTRARFYLSLYLVLRDWCTVYHYRRIPKITGPRK